MGSTPEHNPVEVDPQKCIACVLCDWVCPGDIIYNNAETKELPEIRYASECWYCGLCEQACPTGAITIIFPESMLRCETSVSGLLGKPEAVS